MNKYRCPKCNGVLTYMGIFGGRDYICDVCGYGKSTIEECVKLQLTKKRIK